MKVVVPVDPLLLMRFSTTEPIVVLPVTTRLLVRSMLEPVILPPILRSLDPLMIPAEPNVPDVKASPPKITDGASRPPVDLFPETNSLTPLASAGNLLDGESAMISVPDIAVVEVNNPPEPTLPEIVPISAMSSPAAKYQLSISLVNKYY